MKNLIIKKWVEPYKLLEMVKQFCIFTDYSFDGTNKIAVQNKMFSEIENSDLKFALYMKNVNKFYIFEPKDDFKLLSKLTEVFGFDNSDYEIIEDSQSALSLVDYGKSEASFINI